MEFGGLILPKLAQKSRIENSEKEKRHMGDRQVQIWLSDAWPGILEKHIGCCA